jgi:RNA polymerase sigma-70 factor (ECF subfamily)
MERLATGALPAALELSDEEVVQRVRAGETGLFEVVMRRYNQRLFRVARAIVRDDSEAEDVMQQAYVNAYLHLAQFEGRARFATWLTRIAVHEASARARRRRRLTELEPEGEEADPRPKRDRELDPEQLALAGEVRRALEAAIETLPESYRTIFVLREVEGLSTQETAGCLAVSQDVVKTRMHRARQRLRTELLRRVGLATSDVFSFHLVRCDRVVDGFFARMAAVSSSPAIH